MNTANAIYGMIAAVGLFFVLIGLAIFLFIWEVTQEIMLLILAWGIGLGITIELKVLLTGFCRKRFFRAFYRVNPGKANLSALALECWFIGLGGGVLISRISQFLMAAAFWIGRIDEPFLADNVELLGYKFDYLPLNYVQDLLVHEAHRHPYLERLASMYLMRLRHKSFGSRAGACWRQLFALMLMPWLMKYRVFHEQRCAESLKDQDTERHIKEEEDKDAAIAIAEDLVEKGAAAGQIGIDAVGLGTKFVTEGTKAVGKVGLTAVDVGLEGTKTVGQAGIQAVDAGARMFGRGKTSA